VNLAFKQSVRAAIQANVMKHIVRPAPQDLQRELKGKCSGINAGFRDVHPAQFTGLMNKQNMEESAKQMV
jgi:hypothetical protein